MFKVNKEESDKLDKLDFPLFYQEIKMGDHRLDD